MKRLFAFLLACVCALALFGCAGANDDKSTVDLRMIRRH